MKILSLGAGVQSTCLYLMSIKGIVDRLDCAIFSDTEREPPHVYETLRQLQLLEIPIYVCKHKNAGNDIEFVKDIPVFLSHPNGIGRRQCTKKYKIYPIRKVIRQLTAKPVELWLGFTVEEVGRMKDSDVKYITNRYPLIDLGMKYEDCRQWIANNYSDIKVDKSACTCCPFHSNAGWKNIKEKYPEEFLKVVKIDEELRINTNYHGIPYLHQKRIPLKDVEFKNDIELGQLELFENACGSNCGT